VRGEVQLGRLGRITLRRMDYGMLGYVLVPTTPPAPRVVHVGNWARNAVEMNNW
jgi:hypothetical protein